MRLMDTELYSEHSPTRSEQRVALLLAHDFPPYGMESSLRPLKLAKYLPDFQWNMVVLAATPPEGSLQDEPLLGELTGRPVHVYRTGSSIGGLKLVQGKNDNVPYLPGTYRQRMGSIVEQSLHQPERGKDWLKEALAVGRHIIKEEKVEIILATAPPFTSLLVAQKLSQEFDIPFVVEYRDAWVDSTERFYATPFHRSAGARLENEMLKLAEKIIVVSRHTKELLLRTYGFLEHNDVRIIPHGYDPADIEAASDFVPSRERFTLVTTMNFTGKQSPLFFLKAVKKFLTATPEARERLDIRFAGLLPKRSAKLIKKYKLEDCVSYDGALTHAEKMRHLAQAHVTWFVHRNNYQPPEELYAYMGIHKPIIAAVPQGVMSTTVQDTLAALVTPPGNVDAMATAIGEYYRQWLNRSLPVPKEQFVEHFTYPALAADYSRELGLAMKLV